MEIFNYYFIPILQQNANVKECGNFLDWRIHTLRFFVVQTNYFKTSILLFVTILAESRERHFSEKVFSPTKTFLLISARVRESVHTKPY